MSKLNDLRREADAIFAEDRGETTKALDALATVVADLCEYAETLEGRIARLEAKLGFPAPKDA